MVQLGRWTWKVDTASMSYNMSSQLTISLDKAFFKASSVICRTSQLRASGTSPSHLLSPDDWERHLC